MAIQRRRRPTKRSIMVRFQPWLIAGGVILNVVATGSAALSAYYTSQQSGLAISAVNRQSRNEAFSELVKAQDALCRVSITGQEVVYFPNFGSNGMFEEVSYEDMESRRGTLDIDDYLSRWEKAYEERERRFLYFQLWISEDEFSAFHTMTFSMGPRELRKRIVASKAPAEVEVLKEITMCNAQMLAGVAYYQRTDMDKDFNQFMTSQSVYVWPRSDSGKPLKDMLTSWGYEETFDVVDQFQNEALDLSAD